MQYAIATVCLSGTLPQKIKAISAAGFSAIEIMESDLLLYDGSAKDIRNMAHDHGLEIIAYQPLRDFEGLPEPHRSKMFYKAERKFDLMADLDCDLLMICSSVSPYALGGLQRAADDFHELADIAQKRKMRVAFEALSWGRHIHDYRDSWEVVRRANHDHLGLCLDTFHIFSRGVEINSILNVPGDKIFLVQLADAPRMRMDHLSWSRHYRCFPGQGELPVGEFMTNLKETGYQGPLSLEIFNDQFRSGSVQQNAKDAYRSLVYINNKTEKKKNPALAAVEPPKKVSFIEFAIKKTDRKDFSNWLSALGFGLNGVHKVKDVEHWKQGQINLILNYEPDSFAQRYHKQHGSAVCAIGLEVSDAEIYLKRAQQLNFHPVKANAQNDTHGMNAIAGIGESLLYLVDQKNLPDLWLNEFEHAERMDRQTLKASNLSQVDHLAFTMNYEEMLCAILQHRSLFGMAASSNFDVFDPSGIVRSQIMRTPDRAVNFTFNSSAAPKTVTNKLIEEYHGSGVNHIALNTQSIFVVAKSLKGADIPLMKVPDNYYDDVEATYQLSPEIMTLLRENNVLYCADQNGAFYQLFTGLFRRRFCFEIVQRLGYDGFGEANSFVRTAMQASELKS